VEKEEKIRIFRGRQGKNIQSCQNKKVNLYSSSVLESIRAEGGQTSDNFDAVEDANETKKIICLSCNRLLATVEIKQHADTPSSR